MVMVGSDVVEVERRLRAGELVCACGGGLVPWGHARQRSVRGVGDLRPRRARCGTCLATHVLLAVSWTSYGFVKRRVALDPITSLTGELLVLVVPAVAIVVARFGESDGVPRSASSLELLLVLGTGLITAAPLLLFAYSAKRVPFTILGPANYLIPIINFLLGWLVFDEALPASRVVGFALVWCALIFATLDMVRGADRPGIANQEVRTAEEDLLFSLPKELRQDSAGKRDDRALGGRARA